MSILNQSEGFIYHSYCMLKFVYNIGSGYVESTLGQLWGTATGIKS